MHRNQSLLGNSSLVIVWVLFGAAAMVRADEQPLTARQAVEQMGCGLNLGNTLEPPSEGAWNNPPAQQRYFHDIRVAGFTWVRLPIHWGSHLAAEPPYTLDPAWLDRVEQVVDWGLAEGLFVSFDAHHEQWLKERAADPSVRARFVSLWRQVAERLKHKPAPLIFELLHDPVGMSPENVDELNARCLAVIRESQPTRLVAISSQLFPAPGRVLAATIPDDPYVLGTVYFFHPPAFTFEGRGNWGSDKQRSEVRDFFATLVDWSEANRLPLILREFGVTSQAEPASRARFYAAVVKEAKAHRVPFAAWDDGADFEIYRRSNGSWNALKDILTGAAPANTSGRSP
jgi:hypothetical protein